MKKSVEGKGIPPAVGPYSAAIRHGDTLYTSGQLPLNAATGEMCGGSITDMARVIFSNITTILESEGFTLNDVVKVTVFSKSMAHFAEFNTYYATLFDKPYPARSFIEVARLPKDAELEVEVIAIKK